VTSSAVPTRAEPVIPALVAGIYRAQAPARADGRIPGTPARPAHSTGAATTSLCSGSLQVLQTEASRCYLSRPGPSAAGPLCGTLHEHARLHRLGRRQQICSGHATDGRVGPLGTLYWKTSSRASRVRRGVHRSTPRRKLRQAASEAREPIPKPAERFDLFSGMLCTKANLTSALDARNSCAKLRWTTADANNARSAA
jgi:hypothetical protein